MEKESVIQRLWHWEVYFPKMLNMPAENKQADLNSEMPCIYDMAAFWDHIVSFVIFLGSFWQANSMGEAEFAQRLHYWFNILVSVVIINWGLSVYQNTHLGERNKTFFVFPFYFKVILCSYKKSIKICTGNMDSYQKCIEFCSYFMPILRRIVLPTPDPTNEILMKVCLQT